MARTNAAYVKEILDTALGDTVIEGFIATANVWVDARLLNAGMSDTILTEIEKYLAAHLATVREPQASQFTTGDGLAVKIQGLTGEGLKATYYGQMALMLDSSGTLAAMGKQVALFEVY